MIGLQRWSKVKQLREKLNGKAKAEPEFRFYILYDKVYRTDVLEASYAQCRRNAGAPGVDGSTFENIEKYGIERYLEELAKELKEEQYTPSPVRRVRIPKKGKPGQFRPLGIPTIRDRIVQQAVKLLLEPIFEADFTDNAYGYREGKSAHDALQAVDEALRSGHVDVVDTDLSQYFDTIPHAELMQSVQRRVADRRVLRLIRAWLKVPVHETNERGRTVITGGRKTKRGTPQGGVISPLLANIYFRRFLKAWQQFGLAQRFQARIVNYADDFVILTRKRAQESLQAARHILERMGLKLNEAKTRTCRAWQESFDFLGYTFGKRYNRHGQPYLNFAPSTKKERQYREEIHRLTVPGQGLKEPEQVAQAINRVTRGFWNYFCLGDTQKSRGRLDEYLTYRMYTWAKHKYARPQGNQSPAIRRRQWKAKLRQAVDLLVRGRDLVPVACPAK